MVDLHTEDHQTGNPLDDHQVETYRKNTRKLTSRRTSGKFSFDFLHTTLNF